MKQLAIALLTLSILAGFGWYYFVWKNDSPHLTVIAPSGGEIWQVGEEHTISWDTSNIPARYNISVTIERVPPPPLQEEGQEFDPIVFVNLPNTGSTVWKIPPMYPDGTYVLSIHAYESVPVTEEIVGISKPFMMRHSKLSTDAYPLYPDADWQTAEVEQFTIGSTIYKGTGVTTTSIHANMNPAEIFEPFEQYYKEKLTPLGWTIANDLAAGGHTGGQTGYRKDGQIILTRFSINYQNIPDDAPSECPCDVTLSIFSTE